MTDAIQELADDQKSALRRIEALLRIADKGKGSKDEHTANEAASAAAKAQELLVAYNLDASMLGASGADGRREEAKFKGGFYKYQQDLWAWVAELNFCLHWISGEYVEERTSRKDPWDGRWYQVTQETWKKRHRLVGKRINVLATVQMAQYLEAAIERLVRERIGNQNNLLWSRWATSYREGAASTIINKLYERREEMLAEEKRKEMEAREAAERAGRAGVSTETALTIASVTQSERDANLDHLYGEGWSAERRAKRAAAAEAQRKAQEAYTAWAAANPEEARAKEAEANKERQKRDKRRTGAARAAVAEARRSTIRPTMLGAMRRGTSRSTNRSGTRWRGG